MIGRRLFHHSEQFAGLLVLAMLSAATARADGLMGHSVSYDVKPAPAEKAYIEAQASFTLSRSCEGWSLGEVFQFGIEKGDAAANKKLSDKAERFEERVSSQEPTSGRALAYQTRMRQNARVTTTTGTATLGAATPGKLSATIGRYVQDSVLPPGTLAPAAARAALLEALASGRPGAIEIRTVDILRFHKPVLQTFLRLGPEDGSIARGLPKDMRASTKEFASGQLWALRRQVPEFNEFGDELWLFHDSGAIVRQIVQRQGLKLLLEAREVSTFPAPRCP